MRVRWRLWVVAATALALVASCASKKAATSWTATGFTKKSVRKVLVLGVSDNPLLRRLYEDTFAVELEKLGYETVSAYLWAPDAAKLDKDALLGRMKAEHVTSVVVARVVPWDDVSATRGPTVAADAVHGPAYYGSWSTYYETSYAAADDPADATGKAVVTLETNLYDASGPKDALVWSGTSRIWTDRSRPEKKIGSRVSSIVSRMKSARVL